MSETRTDKSKYPSKYSPNAWVTGAQYILELVCEKRAANEGKVLPLKFWRLEEWEKIFKLQLRKCHTLLKKFDERAIIRALESKQGQRIYSLHSPFLVNLIKIEQVKLNKEIEKIKEIQKSTIQSVVPEGKILPRTRPKRVDVGIIGTLKNLDDEADNNGKEEKE